MYRPGKILQVGNGGAAGGIVLWMFMAAALAVLVARARREPVRRTLGAILRGDTPIARAKAVCDSDIGVRKS